jgi:hypothetical protein
MLVADGTATSTGDLALPLLLATGDAPGVGASDGAPLLAVAAAGAGVAAADIAAAGVVLGDAQGDAVASGDASPSLSPVSSADAVAGGDALGLLQGSSSDAPGVGADLFAIIRNLRPDGAEATYPGPQPQGESGVAVAYGWLRVSHRKLDPERSTAYRPYHPHDKVQKVHPGEVVPVEIQILPTSAIFERGHRLVVEIAADDPMIFFQHDDPRDRIQRGTVTLHTGGAFDARVLLPVIPPGL